MGGPNHTRHEQNEQSSTTELRDRRRPGRPETVSPGLLPLLRGQMDAQLQAETELGLTQFGNPDQIRAATGIMVSLAVSAVLWFCLVRTAQLIF